MIAMVRRGANSQHMGRRRWAGVDATLDLVRDGLGHHGNAVEDRAHGEAEIAAGAVVGDDRQVGLGIEADGLIARVVAAGGVCERGSGVEQRVSHRRNENMRDENQEKRRSEMPATCQGDRNTSITYQVM